LQADPEIIETLKCIAAHLGVTETTALAYSRLNEDPLPMRMRRGICWARKGCLDEWKCRRSGGDGLLRIRGWERICEALGKANKDTAIKWTKLEHDRLPVYGMGTTTRTGHPWIYASALRDWLDRHDLPIQVVRQLRTMSNATRAPDVAQDKPNKRRTAA